MDLSMCILLAKSVIMRLMIDTLTSRYWKDPGAFVDGGIGLVSVLLTAGFSFQGTEIGNIPYKKVLMM